MKIIVILGAPGSGKGTVAARLVKKLPLRHVSTGDLLRAAAKNADTPAKKAVAETMRKGELVSDEIVGKLVVEQLSSCTEEYLLLDGYPRNEKQAAFLEAELAKNGAKVAKAVWLDVPEDVLVGRLSGRRTCPKCGAGFHVETMKPKVEGRLRRGARPASRRPARQRGQPPEGLRGPDGASAELVRGPRRP